MGVVLESSRCVDVGLAIPVRLIAVTAMISGFP